MNAVIINFISLLALAQIKDNAYRFLFWKKKSTDVIPLLIASCVLSPFFTASVGYQYGIVRELIFSITFKSSSSGFFSQCFPSCVVYRIKTGICFGMLTVLFWILSNTVSFATILLFFVNSAPHPGQRNFSSILFSFLNTATSQKMNSLPQCGQIITSDQTV